MRELATPRTFGCARCYGDDPDIAWERTEDLGRVRRLVDDSHFIVQILRCKQCGQHFVWITTEIVDWSGGDDAQYRRVIPLTEAEADALGNEPTPDELRPFADGRRYLQIDWPTGAIQPATSWTTAPLSFVTLASTRKRRPTRRAGVWVGAVGSCFVLAAIPTDSRVIVAIGLILIVVAHALFFAADYRR